MNIDSARSYATEKNLNDALEKLDIHQYRHVVVCNRAGRFTAIFPASSAGRGYMGLFAQHGFLTLG